MKGMKRLTLIRLVLPIVSIFTISLIAFLVLYLRADSHRQAEFELEAGKATLTVMAGVFITGILAFIVNDYEDRRRDLIKAQETYQKYKRLLRTDLLDGMSKLYFRAKALRRQIRANITEDNYIDGKKYGEYLQEISDIQLGIERYAVQAKRGVEETVVPEEVRNDLKSMEKYLNNLVKEYEHAKLSEGKLAMSSLPELLDFVGTYQESRFRSCFVRPYRNVDKVVAMACDKLNSPLTNA